jgi:hypothetical protein
MGVMFRKSKWLCHGKVPLCLGFSASCSDIILAMATDTTNSKVAGVKVYQRQT